MLVTLMSGFRRMLEVWPVIVVSGIAFAGTQFVVSNVLGPELADLLAALITVVAVDGLLSFWRPSSEWHFENEPAAEERESPPMGRTLYAWSPFIIIVALFLLVQVPRSRTPSAASRLP
jgi:lactate permease